MDASTDLSSDCDSVSDSTTYRCIVGSLQYLVLTCPKISFATSKLYQFMSNPKVTHLQALKRVLRYLFGMQQHGITLCRANMFNLSAYCNVDWGGDKVDKHSQTRFIVYLDDSLISWSLRKQATVTSSNTELEFHSITSTTAELDWLNSLLLEFDITILTPFVIYCDNMSATHFARNSSYHTKMKHVALNFNFIRELVEEVNHISSKRQRANVLKAPLSGPLHTIMRQPHQ